LGGSVDKKLLAVRVFDDKVKQVAYAKQTQAAQARASPTARSARLGTPRTRARIYKFNEMDADHVSAWSKGGESSADELPDALQYPQSGQRVIDSAFGNTR
jgi:hypothetical protein